MIRKVELSSEQVLTGELIGVIVPPNTNIASLRIETNDYLIIDWRDVIGGYYPIKVQTRDTNGEYFTSGFEHFQLVGDNVFVTGGEGVILLLKVGLTLEV